MPNLYVPLFTEVGVCSFARFSGDFPQAGCSSLNPLTQKEELCEVVKESRDRTLLFSAQEMVQCCKVGPATSCTPSFSPCRVKCFRPGHRLCLSPVNRAGDCSQETQAITAKPTRLPQSYRACIAVNCVDNSLSSCHCSKLMAPAV